MQPNSLLGPILFPVPQPGNFGPNSLKSRPFPRKNRPGSGGKTAKFPVFSLFPGLAGARQVRLALPRQPSIPPEQAFQRPVQKRAVPLDPGRLSLGNGAQGHDLRPDGRILDLPRQPRRPGLCKIAIDRRLAERRNGDPSNDVRRKPSDFGGFSTAGARCRNARRAGLPGEPWFRRSPPDEAAQCHRA